MYVYCVESQNSNAFPHYLRFITALEYCKSTIEKDILVHKSASVHKIPKGTSLKLLDKQIKHSQDFIVDNNTRLIHYVDSFECSLWANQLSVHHGSAYLTIFRICWWP